MKKNNFRTITRNKKKSFFIVLIIILSLLKIPLPRFIFGGYKGLHALSIMNAQKAGRSVWVYTPQTDTFIIKDSLRNIEWKIKEAAAYDAQWYGDIYFQFFFPWVDVINHDNYLLWGVWFEYINIWDKTNSYGIDLRMDTISHSLAYYNFHRWDYKKYDFSYYGKGISIPLKDTLYLSAWGYSDIYLEQPLYKFSEEERNQLKQLLGTKLRSHKDQFFLGEIIFVKTDSIISDKKKKQIERKLFSIYIKR